jgi:alkaline phosphatase D
MKQFFSLLCLLTICNLSNAQSIIGLPMAGHLTSTSVQILVIAQDIDKIQISYLDKKTNEDKSIEFEKTDTSDEKYCYFKGEINDLQSDTEYTFKISPLRDNHSKKTLELKVHTPSESPIYDMDFLIGSCLAPFKGIFLPLRPRLKILDTMRETNADFMIWMGDNVYFLSGEWNEYDSMIKKMIDYRKQKKISRFLNHQPNYSTWDDHDFGPNNGTSNFENKDLTKEVFNKFWENPKDRPDSIEGIFYKFSRADADFFVMDSRYHRVTNQHMFGAQQMNWLKQELKNSTATFKFIVSSTQSLPHTYGENWSNYPLEKADFMNFIEEQQIEGLIFLSGDTHYPELNKIERKDNYTLVEITSSALTSPTFPGAKKMNQGNREPNTFSKKKNFGHISIKGNKKDRICRIEIKDKRGKIIWSYQIHEKDLIKL